MFCKNCGRQISDNASFCSSCGSPSSAKPPYPDYVRIQPSIVGFSPRINDPAFLSYKKKSSSWSLIFAAILAVIAMVGFPIYGNASGEIEWPNSLFYGMGIGGMFIVIAIAQTIKRNLDKTWDGMVIHKDTYRETDNRDSSTVSYRTVYVLKIKKDAGGTKTHKWRDSPGLYDYYNLGDRVGIL